MTPPNRKKRPLIDRLTDEMRILRAAAALEDGRTAHAKALRHTADLIGEAVMFMLGVEFSHKGRER